MGKIVSILSKKRLDNVGVSVLRLRTSRTTVGLMASQVSIGYKHNASPMHMFLILEFLLLWKLEPCNIYL